MRFEIITIFPAFFASIFEHGVLSRALESDRVRISVHDLREATQDRHRTVDDRPFGGGEGMVLKPEPIAETVARIGVSSKADRVTSHETVVLLSAQGRPFTQAVARELAQLERVVLLCGRYEGIDERVNELIADRELSIGDYVLSGGELAAAVILDAVVRLLPGVLGNDASSAFESFGPADASLDAAPAAGTPPRSTHGAGGLLDYPHYTRPVEWCGLKVPDVLCGGNHEQIRRWRREQALLKTLRNRPDLLENADLSPSDRRFLASIARAKPADPV